MQHQEHQQSAAPAVAPPSDAGTGRAPDGPVDESTARSPEPLEVLLLDYDRELLYLDREGRLRRGQRPTGFKR